MPQLWIDKRRVNNMIISGKIRRCGVEFKAMKTTEKWLSVEPEEIHGCVKRRRGSGDGGINKHKLVGEDKFDAGD